VANTLYEISFEVPYQYASAYAECIEPYLDSVSWGAREGVSIVRVFGFTNQLPDKGSIKYIITHISEVVGVRPPIISIKRKPVRDWVQDNLKKFFPITVGRYFVCGVLSNARIPYGKIGLNIPASAAFGTGDHGSTKGCLIAFNRIIQTTSRQRIRWALDMGCGSGILAIAIAKSLHVPVIAVDNDPNSIQVAKKNIKTNGVLPYVRIVCGEGYKHPEITIRTYDLIVSNILAKPLMRFAKDLKRHLAPGGFAVLSGLLSGDANRIISVYAYQGLSVFSRIEVDEWQTLVLRNTIGKK